MSIVWTAGRLAALALALCVVAAAAALAGCSDTGPPRPQTRVLASGLDAPCALGMDRRGNIYVAEAGAGRVVIVGEEGESTVVAEGLFGLCGLAVERSGGFYVSLPEQGAVHWYSRTGAHRVAVSGLDRPAALTMDRLGRLYIVEQGAGRMLRMEPGGEVETVAWNGPGGNTTRHGAASISVASDARLPNQISATDVTAVIVDRDGGLNLTTHRGDLLHIDPASTASP